MRANSDLDHAMKLAISRMANRHRPGSLPNIAMLSSRRSGTTLVAEVFARAKGVKLIDQPLSQYTAGAAHSRYLPPFAGSYPFQLSSEDRARLRELFVGWHEGRLHFSEPWRAYSPRFKWRTDRLFFKFTEGHAIAEDISEFIPLRSFAFFRHPIPHTISCMRLGWSARGGNFLKQEALLAEYFDRDQIRLIRQIDASGEEFDRVLVNWFVENAPLLRIVATTQNQFPAFTYESLILEPEVQLTRIAEHCRVPLTPAMMTPMGHASRSSGARKTGSEVSGMIKQGDRERIVSAWQERLSPRDTEVTRAVFDTLGCSIYSGDSPVARGL